jgi:hypothetical protein
MVNAATALASGAVGAGVLTLLHESARLALAGAPRMDIVGMRAIDHAMDGMHMELLGRRGLRRAALVSDLVGNSLYYAGVAGRTPAETWKRGVLLGAVAGISVVALPERLGLGTPPNSGSWSNQVMTVAWYVIGGLAAAAAATTAARLRRTAA